MNRFNVFLAVSFLILLSGCGKTATVLIKDNVVKVEVADSDEERSKGLMFKESLGADEGMLFVFDDSKIRTFWMKNTRIPLDIIFISEEFEIVNIAEAEPCKRDPCEIYPSKYEAKYVLEVFRGFVEERNITAGDYIKIVM